MLAKHEAHLALAGKRHFYHSPRISAEGMTGIGPAYFVWKTNSLPLRYIPMRTVMLLKRDNLFTILEDNPNYPARSC
jgi:hypothetical protein